MSDTPKSDFIREIIAADLASGKHATTITRFPPEPNGYLHLGHARAICLNFGIALENAGSGARCHLRFDDTNPEKEEVEYVESIKADVKWLGFEWGDNLYYASDYFEFYYDCAVHLIKNGLAYVDEQTAEQIKDTRGNLTVPGSPSPFRDRSVEENLELFAKMRAGGFDEGTAVLRAKIDMASPNIVLRDPVIYRVLKAEHHNTGDAWCLYPMYDFAHPLEDAKEHITHSLCTLEFEIHRPFYDWVIENCPVPAKPRQIEFSRLNFTYTVMSKRKLLTLVKEGHVAGWDDPRMPTLSGARRRGIPAVAIRKLCEKTGITKFQGITDIAQLEFEIRDYLNTVAPRRMAVIDPLKLVITNWPEGQSEDIELDNHPKDPAMGSRAVKLSRELWIEGDDFMEVPEKKYFRLGPDRHVRLRGGYIVKCTGFEKDDSGKVVKVLCEYLPGTKGADAPEGVECRAAIHWVSAEHGVAAEVRLYDRLFTVEDPDAAEGGFTSVINPDSLKVIQAWVEPALAAAEPETVVQYERLGYFVADRHEHQPGTKPVFNRTIGLRDSWAKK
ncbi:glutamine--tRNA ligase/YqeY domain fusion protein [Luteolibacter sp. GHJ8]|uniref:Glutamine--tRNA ligase n=1 Tax=Luteolibacter rhizosphaerae TaxID=2989719 RepID=A0ABT3FYY7_9BACT|nr:glutamine--tRNA ligase/YqeY domain fusion protein [Luteolibacter rhizosphaerae]MCW1912215.1 glutamine--tRNA ligase/YqeY domain fusion protein [Luteolibacter rhizosphaerae]